MHQLKYAANIYGPRIKHSSALTSAHYSGHYGIQLDVFGSNDETTELLQQGTLFSKKTEHELCL